MPTMRQRIGLLSIGGFTLIELIIAMTMMAVLALAVVPGFKKETALFNLHHTADQIAADIREMQQRSQCEANSQYFLNFYPGINYYVERESAGIKPVNIGVTHFAGTVRLEYTNFAHNTINISAEGIPYPNGGVILLKDIESCNYLYIIVASITGRVRISEKPPDN